MLHQILVCYSGKIVGFVHPAVYVYFHQHCLTWVAGKFRQKLTFNNRITLPARGCNCEHIQCFDLKAYLNLNCKVKSWKCPICNKNAKLEDLNVDKYVLEILETNMSMSEVERVVIDSTAHWKISITKPNVIDLTSEEHNDCHIIRSIANLTILSE